MFDPNPGLPPSCMKKSVCVETQGDRGFADFPHCGCSGVLPLASPRSSLRTLAEYCPALRSLRVRHCHHVAEPSLSRLRKRGVDIDVEPPLHQALVLLQDMAGFAPFVNLQV